MSLDSAKAFLKTYAEDADLRQKLHSVLTQEGRMEIIKTSGFSFTPEELDDVANTDITLDEEQLEAVAGGAGNNYACLVVA